MFIKLQIKYVNLENIWALLKKIFTELSYGRLYDEKINYDDEILMSYLAIKWAVLY
jgi:hypothetical protein